jgi:hypothetical protein
LAPRRAVVEFGSENHDPGAEKMPRGSGWDETENVTGAVACIFGAPWTKKVVFADPPGARSFMAQDGCNMCMSLRGPAGVYRVTPLVIAAIAAGTSILPAPSPLSPTQAAFRMG